MNVQPPSLHTYRLIKTRAVSLVGAPVAWLLLTLGKLYDTPGWSGRYVIDLARSEDGSTALMNLLDKLAAGEAVPILLFDVYALTADFPALQLIDGRLYQVWPGKRELVEFP